MSVPVTWAKDESKQGNVSSYIPSSLEKKTVILAYLLVWLVILLSKKEVSPYVYIHVLRATGRRWLFVANTIVALVVMWIPLVGMIPSVVFVVLGALWLRFVYTAWNQSSVQKEEAREDSTNPLSVFVWIWRWMLGVLEIDLQPKEEQQ